MLESDSSSIPSIEVVEGQPGHTFRAIETSTIRTTHRLRQAVETVQRLLLTVARLGGQVAALQPGRLVLDFLQQLQILTRELPSRSNYSRSIVTNCRKQLRHHLPREQVHRQQVRCKQGCRLPHPEWHQAALRRHALRPVTHSSSQRYVCRTLAHAFADAQAGST